jgi:hypothetical protein
VSSLVFSQGWYGGVFVACNAKAKERLDYLPVLEKIYEMNGKLFRALSEFEPSRYRPGTPAEVKAFDVESILPGFRIVQFGSPQKDALVNSSTNMNRKRGAYILKQYFCDDLTPINVETPEEHSGGQHGSSPSCFACHYKLDPMAGFFRTFGARFIDYSLQDKIVFDDGAVSDRASYENAWRAPAGAGREWNVGYVRSVNRVDLNDYGESIGDLFAIIKRAPEVKRCLVKRAFEYFVSAEQTIDAGYLDQLSREFMADAERDSAEAFKSLVAKILLSQSYSHPDPVATECYDFPPGYDPRGAPPCRVAFIFNKNCTSCHGPSGAAGLDLSSWIQLADGSYGFPHLDASGHQRPRTETFAALQERLSSSSPGRRMPLNRHMDATEREQLYRWVSEVLNEKK